MTFETFLDAALATPFKIGGRDFMGWDCWGLVYCFYREVWGHPIPSYASEYDENLSYRELAALIDSEKADWRSIDRAEVAYGDVGLYRVGEHRSHVALILPRDRMLHCEASVDTVSEPLDNRIWGRRNVGYFRLA